MLRATVLVLSFLSAACSPKNNTVTLCGDPVQKGSDPSGVVATIDQTGLPNVFVNSEKGKVSVGIFQMGTCEPYLQLVDSDSDGVFDLLIYSAMSHDGQVLVSVEDYGMDGQPDFILNFSDSTASVFYEGAWSSVDGIGPGGEQPSVEIEGQRRALGDVLEDIGRRPF